MANTYAISAWFFTRALSVVYFVAFVSLAVQVSGLWGSRGVLPMKGYLQIVEKQVGPSSYWHLPSVFWLDTSDRSIQQAAYVGAAAALLALFGVAQGWMLLACFVLYLSFVTAGQEFMSFQWDALLVEVGFLALFAVPWSFGFKLMEAVEPHWIVRSMFYLVLFKLMFLSGVVKLTSGDESWRDLTALTYHYWTQPLPNPLAPFVHALPKWFHQGGVIGTFFVELILPFFILWPRARLFVAAGFIGLSCTILLTGNYTFFNWLTIALTFWLIPDWAWHWILDRFHWSPTLVQAPVFPHPVVSGVMGVLAMLSLVWCTRWMYTDNMMKAVSPALRLIAPFHISNSYGLFAVMTKSRPEIILEGSMDGTNWMEYEFKYKPGHLYRKPPVIAPHQPRLDWQMWFAALGTFRQNPWMQNLMVRIFENSPEVLGLMSWNPFPNGGPRLLRARMYEYKFASPEEILNDGKWWTREPLTDYTPAFEKP